MAYQRCPHMRVCRLSPRLDMAARGQLWKDDVWSYIIYCATIDHVLRGLARLACCMGALKVGPRPRAAVAN